MLNEITVTFVTEEKDELVSHELTLTRQEAWRLMESLKTQLLSDVRVVEEGEVLMTRAGKVITALQIETWAAEAERGFDVGGPRDA